ncbi:MAG: phosphate acyltransferase PlsX [Bacteroidales bacterium]|jgi:glycerol-3-phosphate acyltransferase PlsX
MRIGIDIMGGDFAPEAAVLGAILAHKELAPENSIVLIGNQQQITDLLKREKVPEDTFEVVPSTDVIEMGEHPAKAFSRKPNSSIAIGYRMLAEGTIDGLASAGSTGAMMVGAMYTVKAIPGIIRPALTTAIPKPDGSFSIILDIGINPDCKPDVLYQYGTLGALYAKHIYQIEDPGVALLNIGSEEEKGNLVVKSAHELMKGSTDFNFIGNIEANELFDAGSADVIVCDGFVGNIVLKQAEAFYKLYKSRDMQDAYFDKLNFERYGGSPILGVNKNIVIGHGISNATAIKGMIKHTFHVAEVNLSNKIKEAIQ